MEGRIELVCGSMVAGGTALARDDDGRVTFVEGGLPGERVVAEVTAERRAYARARVVEVLEPSSDRQAPPCPNVAAGCGGCGWQHVADAAQPRHKRDIVVDALVRLGRVADPTVEVAPSLSPQGHRTTVRLAVTPDGAGFRKRASHEVLTIGECLVAHPAVVDLLARGSFPEAEEVTIRVGARTGERLVLARPSAAGVEVPDDVVVVGGDELAEGRQAWIHEEVAGRRWRVSAGSFFQPGPEGAEALVEQVRLACGDALDGTPRFLDAYCGVGLFAGTIGAEVAAAGGEVVAIERVPAAVADARHNLADLGIGVVAADVDRWEPRPVDLAVADPSRAGLGAAGVGTLTATGADRLVLVSCDPAALGRDAGLLERAGYRLARSVVVDLFPHTSHTEVVSRFDRPRA